MLKFRYEPFKIFSRRSLIVSLQDLLMLYNCIQKKILLKNNVLIYLINSTLPNWWQTSQGETDVFYIVKTVTYSIYHILILWNKKHGNFRLFCFDFWNKSKLFMQQIRMSLISFATAWSNKKRQKKTTIGASYTRYYVPIEIILNITLLFLLTFLTITYTFYQYQWLCFEKKKVWWKLVWRTILTRTVWLCLSQMRSL